MKTWCLSYKSLEVCNYSPPQKAQDCLFLYSTTHIIKSHMHNIMSIWHYGIMHRLFLKFIQWPKCICLFLCILLCIWRPYESIVANFRLTFTSLATSMLVFDFKTLVWYEKNFKCLSKHILKFVKYYDIINVHWKKLIHRIHVWDSSWKKGDGMRNQLCTKICDYSRCITYSNMCEGSIFYLCCLLTC